MKQHVVTIIQGNGEVTTVPLNPTTFWAPEEYVSKVVRDLQSVLPFERRNLVLPLTIHYTEVDS